MELDQESWLTNDIREALLQNGQKLKVAQTLQEENLVPVIFVEHEHAKWLLVSIDPSYPYMAYGLCDLGMGYPELGSVELQPLIDLAHKSKEWDSAPKYPILEYLSLAKVAGCIVLESKPDHPDLAPLPPF